MTAFVPPATAQQQSAHAQQAQEILDATGVTGGLVVHVGCGDGQLTAALARGDGLVVQGIDTSPSYVEAARRHAASLGLAGRVSFARWSGTHLPYTDNLVNLLVSTEPLDLPAAEVLRVLAPGGVAYVGQGKRWTKTVKPWPDDVDQWTHFLRNAGGNAVAEDARIGPPRHVQWMAEPSWSRNHHKLASISSVVSSAGRIFYIIDDGPSASMAVPGHWSLAARDAFSGVLLWTQEIPSWAYTDKKFRSGPVQLTRTLVADESRVYAPLGMNAPVSALDGATGEIVKTYKETDGAEELILIDGILLVVAGSPTAEQAAVDPDWKQTAAFPNEKVIVALKADSGEVLWRWSQPGGGAPVPVTLSADDGRAFFQTADGVVCLNLETGREIWTATSGSAEQAESGRRSGGSKRSKTPLRSAGWAVATLVVEDGVVLSADGKTLIALAADSGRQLWECECKVGFKSSVDVLVVGGLVWLGTDFAEGRDLHTGEIKKTNIPVDRVWTAGHHHRCYRDKATERYLLTAKRGIEFFDLVGDNHTRNNWVRGTCQYGILPSNGLIYAPSHACGCFMEAKLYGFWALASERDAWPVAGAAKSDDARLEPGSAYPVQVPVDPSNAVSRSSSHAPQSSSDWPTHRGNPFRSGSTVLEVADRAGNLWKAGIGGRITAPVVADGTVVVASVDEHRVVALDADSGTTRWTFTAGGRVDSPPTISGGLVLFGSADGWVHAVNLSDGRPAWQFQAAPYDLQTVARDQVESLWPVRGSVLVQNGLAYVAAGRSSHLDGGIVLYALDPKTGKVVHRAEISNVHPSAADVADFADLEPMNLDQNTVDKKTFISPDRADAFSMTGATSDILVGDGTSIYLRQMKFSPQCVWQDELSRHLLSTSGLLDDSENHRSHWVLGTGDFSRTPVAYSWIANGGGIRGGTRLSVPYGLMLAFDDQTVWGVRRAKEDQYVLFGQGNKPFAEDEESLPDFRPFKEIEKGKTPPPWNWSVELPLRPRAMLRAGGSVFLAGMPGATEDSNLTALYAGQEGGALLRVAATDGSQQSAAELESPPVWDGMAAAAGRLFISTQAGEVICLGRP